MGSGGEIHVSVTVLGFGLSLGLCRRMSDFAIILSVAVCLHYAETKSNLNVDLVLMHSNCVFNMTRFSSCVLFGGLLVPLVAVVCYLLFESVQYRWVLACCPTSHTLLWKDGCFSWNVIERLEVFCSSFAAACPFQSLSPLFSVVFPNDTLQGLNGNKKQPGNVLSSNPEFDTSYWNFQLNTETFIYESQSANLCTDWTTVSTFVYRDNTLYK